MIQQATVLDIGCCMGTDLRQLIADGADAANLKGIEINDDFIQLGWSLFEDKDKLKPHNPFEVANILSDSVEEKGKNYQEFLKDYSCHFDYVFAGSVLHLLTFEDGKRFVERVLTFLKAGGLFFGRTVASTGSPGISTVPIDDLG